jgi:hypothetical protein
MFLKKSAIPNEELRKIWLISALNTDFMTREEFFIALKLISYA